MALGTSMRRFSRGGIVVKWKRHLCGMYNKLPCTVPGFVQVTFIIQKLDLALKYVHKLFIPRPAKNNRYQKSHAIPMKAPSPFNKPFR